MYLITNRQISKGKGLSAFGKTPNASGPNELRLMEVNKNRRSWQVSAINDLLTANEVKLLNKNYKLGIDPRKPWYASLKVACELFEKARKEQKSILFFVHGYNNDVEDVVKAAMEIEKIHDVIVVPFTWPANGGGPISGTASYLSDKADARASSGALNRAVGKIQQLHRLLTAARKTELETRAKKKFPDNASAAYSYYVQLMEKDCSVTLNLLCHSMGNYVFKNTLKTSDNVTSKLVFDNICLVAADTNSSKHAEWVGQLDVRSRVNIVINEKDAALKASRLKPGDEQKARLGHYTKKLNSSNAHYIDVTGEPNVGSEHTYFKGDAMKNNALKEMFTEMFNGRAVEGLLKYHADNNSYKFD